MFTYHSPAEYAAGLEEHCLEALRCHCDGCDCSSCPYGPEGSTHDDCSNIFIELLPDYLRYYGDERSLELAENLELCNSFSQETCSSCPYFSRCYAEEDLSFILKDVYDWLSYKQENAKKNNMFNYFDTWWGFFHFAFIGLCVYLIVVYLYGSDINLIYKIIGSIVALFVFYDIANNGIKCINSGKKRAFNLDPGFIIGREKPFRKK